MMQATSECDKSCKKDSVDPKKGLTLKNIAESFKDKTTSDTENDTELTAALKMNETVGKEASEIKVSTENTDKTTSNVKDGIKVTVPMENNDTMSAENLVETKPEYASDISQTNAKETDPEVTVSVKQTSYNGSNISMETDTRVLENDGTVVSMETDTSILEHDGTNISSSSIKPVNEDGTPQVVNDEKDHKDSNAKEAPSGRDSVEWELVDNSKKYEYFWKSHSPFSQWYYSSFEVDGTKYSCCEQFMMHRKAVLFEDFKIAKKVLETKDPRKQKALGRKVRNFDQELWDDNCMSIVEDGNEAKFSQNEDLKNYLYETFPKILVEASPVDRIWGIGLCKDDPLAWDETTWQGKNLLGYALTNVREKMMKKDGMLDKNDELPQKNNYEK